MAEENNEDDSWLYGSSENQENQDEPPQIDEKTITDDTENETTLETSRNDDEYPDDTNVIIH